MRRKVFLDARALCKIMHSEKVEHTPIEGRAPSVGYQCRISRRHTKYHTMESIAGCLSVPHKSWRNFRWIFQSTVSAMPSVGLFVFKVLQQVSTCRFQHLCSKYCRLQLGQLDIKPRSSSRFPAVMALGIRIAVDQPDFTEFILCGTHQWGLLYASQLSSLLPAPLLIDRCRYTQLLKSL